MARIMKVSANIPSKSDYAWRAILEFLENKMKYSIAIAMTIISLSPLWPSHVLAKALAKADIEGRKICWDGGNTWNRFSPGGKVTNNIAGEGTWSISKAGVIRVKFPSGPYSGVVRDLGGGAFEYSGSWVGVPKLTVDGGAYCD
jgi:hypothetical protein